MSEVHNTRYPTTVLHRTAPRGRLCMFIWWHGWLRSARVCLCGVTFRWLTARQMTPGGTQTLRVGPPYLALLCGLPRRAPGARADVTFATGPLFLEDRQRSGLCTVCSGGVAAGSERWKVERLKSGKTEPSVLPEFCGSPSLAL